METTIKSLRSNRIEAKAFVGFVLSDQATRPSQRGRRQKLPLAGRDVSYGVKVQRRRGSDRAERIYVAVAALQNAGLTNHEACGEVAFGYELGLGKSRRGRPQVNVRARDFLDKVEIIRSLYNRFKEGHPWKEQLPERDLVYEHWYWRFRNFEQFAADKIMAGMREGWSGEEFANELLHNRGIGGQRNYEAMVSLGEVGLVTAVTSRSAEVGSEVKLAQLKRFVREFVRAASA